MAMTRIWNITDDASSDVKPQNLVLFGHCVHPGKFLVIDESQLVGARKVEKAVKEKLLYVGKKLPSSYSQARTPSRAKLVGEVKGHPDLSKLAAEAKKKPAPKPKSGPKTEPKAESKSSETEDKKKGK